LRDGTQVYLDGARVDDVTTYPAYRNAMRSICGLFVHDYWEEVFLVPGALIVCSRDGDRETFTAHTYACRPPGVLHGPFESITGCLLLESHYYSA